MKQCYLFIWDNFSIVMVSLALTTLFISAPAHAQHHYDYWVHKNASDTTIVRCWNDSMTTVMFPPGSMTGMMMMPDSAYCRIDDMPMDSLMHPHDSTFMGWHRMRIGRDSMNFDMMNDQSQLGGTHMMQFMMNMLYHLHWDSMMTDSMHRNWRTKNIRGWNGSQWIAVSGVTFDGNDAVFNSPETYSAFAFTGEPGSVLGVQENRNVPSKFTLGQNYPNPFNPSTTISYALPQSAYVTLAVYSTLGERVATLVDGEQQAGSHNAIFQNSKLSSGIYFYRFQAGTYVEVKKLVLIK
ncbi:MAG: T9SS type A sorting domain-containing protein [Bacteroidota bacterium]